MSEIVVAALYKFAPLENPTELKASLEAACREARVTGTLILSSEGINGTIAGSRTGINAVLAVIREIPGLTDLEHKESHAAKPPFYRLKVRLKQEIVTMGVPGVNPAHAAGAYVEPRDWNALIADPDVVVIDTRNDYEARIGTFEGAVNPQTDSFRAFPEWFRQRQDQFEGRKIAMFCTGGIRCEKATAFLKTLGFDDVYHLKGGILKYLETVPPEQSLWRGECFVFDSRAALSHGLEEGTHDLCHGCRMPVSAADKASSDYMPGVSCPSCRDRLSPKRKARLAERQKQIALAKRRGTQHIGVPSAKAKR